MKQGKLDEAEADFKKVVCFPIHNIQHFQMENASSCWDDASFTSLIVCDEIACQEYLQIITIAADAANMILNLLSANTDVALVISCIPFV